jgi:hypothetical protein
MGAINFLMDFAKKKGSNLADKQDVAFLTREIEGVKNGFTADNEHLKANLQMVINNQLQHSNEERNAIISFYENYSKWLNIGLLDFVPTGYNRNKIDDLIEKSRSLNDYHRQTNIAQSRVYLLVDNQKIINLSNELVMEMLKFNHWTQNIILNLQLNLESDKTRFEMFMILSKMKPLPAEALEIASEEKELLAKKKQICDGYYHGISIEFDKVLKIQSQFAVEIKAYLSKLKGK